MKTRLVTTMVSVLLLSACAGTSAQTTTVTARVPVTVTAEPSGSSRSSTAAAGSPQAASPSSVSANEPVPLGSTQSIGAAARVTAHSVDRTVPPEKYSSDQTPRTAIDVEVCIDAPSRGVSGEPWSLTDANGGRYTPVSYTSDPKLPEYPSAGAPVAVGECIRGWLIMAVPPDAAITGVRYGLSDGTVLRWAVSA